MTNAKLQIITLSVILLSFFLTSSVYATNSESDVSRGAIRGMAPQFVNLDEDLKERRVEDVEAAPTRRVKAEEPWFKVLLATIVVNVIALIGILWAIPVMINKSYSMCKSMFWEAEKKITAYENEVNDGSEDKFLQDREGQDESKRFKTFDNFAPSFLCGVFLSTIFFLVIPQSLAFIQISLLEDAEENVKDKYEILNGTVVRFGICLLVGFLFPIFLNATFPRVCHLSEEDDSMMLKTPKDVDGNKYSLKGTFDGGKAGSDSNEDDNEANETDSADVQSTKTGKTTIATKKSYMSKSSDLSMTLRRIEESEEINTKLCYAVLVGNTAFNFLDGIIIGVAFMTCSDAISACVVIITIIHEVQVKVTDYFVLTNEAGVTIPRALLLNFISSFAVVVGGMLILGISVGTMTIGVFLAFAGGLYLYTAANECLCRMNEVVTVGQDRLLSLAFFLFGAVPIALTLLESDYCYTDEA